MSDQPLQHHPPTINARAVMWFGIGLAASLALIALVVGIYLLVLQRSHPSRARNARTMEPRVTAPPPQLQGNPAADLAIMRAREEAVLHSYGWVDRKAGVIRIPIERAIELTAERGLPARKSPPAAP